MLSVYQPSSSSKALSVKIAGEAVQKLTSQQLFFTSKVPLSAEFLLAIKTATDHTYPEALVKGWVTECFPASLKDLGSR
mgnify:CR=1 FL=1